MTTCEKVRSFAGLRRGFGHSEDGGQGSKEATLGSASGITGSVAVAFWSLAGLGLVSGHLSACQIVH